MKFLSDVGNLVTLVRKSLPRTLFGGGLNEAILATYAETLQCGGELGLQSFAASALASNSTLGSNALIVDIGKPRVQEFYVCVGKILIDEGVTYLHFEAPVLVLNAASSRVYGVRGYRREQRDLLDYAREKRSRVFFSEDPGLANIIQLDGIYMPSRFFSRDRPEFVPLPKPCLESRGGCVGYTYARSRTIIENTFS